MKKVTRWAQEKANEIIRRNHIGSVWIVFNELAGVVATDTKMTADFVAAFAEAGYEMRQPSDYWEIRKKS